MVTYIGVKVRHISLVLFSCPPLPLCIMFTHFLLPGYGIPDLLWWTDVAEAGVARYYCGTHRLWHCCGI